MNKTEFDNEQFLSAYPDGVENNYWTIARNLIIKETLLKNNLHGKKILEIGCGRGIVVDFLRKSNFDCNGVELSEIQIKPDLASYIKSGTDFVSLDKDFSDKVEIILLLDVIEHLPNATEFLNSVKNNFKNLKYLIITVPARMDIWSNYDTFYGHYTRYDLKTLNDVVGKVGFGKTWSSYFFHLLYLPAKLLKLFGKNREVKINSPFGFFVFINKILGNLFLFEYRFLPSWIFGTSIISVSKKE